MSAFPFQKSQVIWRLIILGLILEKKGDRIGEKTTLVVTGGLLWLK